MVTRYGMHEKLGYVTYEKERPTLLGLPGETLRAAEFSGETAREIDCAIREIVEAAYAKALGVLTQRRAALERGAQLLLQKETLGEEEIAALRQAVATVRAAPVPGVEAAA
jgi:cell division protease FtsH